MHVTNVEQTRDMIHGFGLIENNINLVMDPGETKTFHIKLTKPGVFPYYCTNFCSALHQEMQGYLVVSNAGSLPGAVYRTPRRTAPAATSGNSRSSSEAGAIGSLQPRRSGCTAYEEKIIESARAGIPFPRAAR